MTTITTPVEGYNGPGPAGIMFQDGTAETDNEAVISYCRAAGYGIDGEPPVRREDPQPIDSREVVDPTSVGSRLRDASTDPRPEDFLPPTNAGEADPHGPLVVAPGIHAIETQVVRPGIVHVNDLAAQQEAETEQAHKLLVENQPVGDALATFKVGRVDDDGNVIDGSDTGPLGLSDPGSVKAIDTGNAADLDESKNPDGTPNPSAGTYDPSGYSVSDVNDYLAGADADERARVLALEAATEKPRKGIVEGPHAAA